MDTDKVDLSAGKANGFATANAYVEDEDEKSEEI